MKGVFLTLFALMFFGESGIVYGGEDECMEREQVVAHDEKSGWSFVSVSVLCSDSGGFEHRFEARQGQNKIMLLEHLYKGLLLEDAIHCENFSVYFFSLPRIRPYGNIVLGWIIPQKGIPKLVFTSPFSDNFTVYSEITELKKVGEFVCGSIHLKNAEKTDAPGLDFEFTLSGDEPSIRVNLPE